MTSDKASASILDDTWLTSTELAAIRKAIGVLGESKVAKLLSLKRHTMARVVAGLGVQRGTVALVRAGMAAHAAEFSGGDRGEKAAPSRGDMADDGAAGKGNR